MNAKRLVLLGRLAEAIESKQPNMVNHCRGLINTLISMEEESVGVHVSDTGITFVNSMETMPNIKELIEHLSKERMMK